MRLALIFGGIAVALGAAHWALASLSLKTHGAVISALLFVFAVLETILTAAAKSLDDLADAKALKGHEYVNLIKLIEKRRGFLHRVYVWGVVSKAVGIVCGLWLYNEPTSSVVANRLLIVGYAAIGWAAASVVMALITSTEATRFRTKLRLMQREDQSRDDLIQRLNVPAPPPDASKKNKKLTGILLSSTEEV